MTGAHILVVEDEADLRIDMIELLTAEGYIVTSASDGIEALALIKRSRPDLVLCDVQLPGMGGIALLKELCAFRGDRPAMLMITAYGDEDTLVAIRSLGVQECMIKPICFDTLVARVRHCLHAATPAQYAVRGETPLIEAPLRLPMLLIVEDEEELASEMIDLFACYAHHALAAGSVSEAMAKLRENQNIVGVLIDLTLRAENGLDVIRMTARDSDLAERNLQFAILSGASCEPEELSRLPIAPVDIMMKPAQPTELIRFADKLPMPSALLQVV